MKPSQQITIQISWKKPHFTKITKQHLIFQTLIVMGGELRDIVTTRKSIRAMVSPTPMIDTAISHPLMQFSGYSVGALRCGITTRSDRVGQCLAPHHKLHLLSLHSFLQTTHTTITSFIHEYKQHIQQLNDPSLSFRYRLTIQPQVSEMSRRDPVP